MSFIRNLYMWLAFVLPNHNKFVKLRQKLMLFLYSASVLCVFLGCVGVLVKLAIHFIGV